MPPRYAYWTILVDEQPTAFRAGDRDDLQPTFKRLQAKHPSARMVWFQNGKIWNSRLDAQEAMRVRGQRGREGDLRQKPDDRDRAGKLEWRPKPSGAAPGVVPGVAPGFSRGRSNSGTRRNSGDRHDSGARRDRNWRPGGEHKDPRQKYKDAKKAKWGRLKQTIRKRWEAKQGKKKEGE